MNTTIDTEAIVRQALDIVNSYDSDRARHRNGVGFNSADGDFARSLLGQSRWTPRQLAAAHRIAKKYRGQHKLDVGPPPAVNRAPREPAENELSKKLVTVDGDRVIFTFPFSYDTNDWIKRTQGARWDGQAKVWWVEAKRLDTVGLRLLVEDGWAISSYVRDLVGGVVSTVPSAAPVVVRQTIVKRGTQAEIPSLAGLGQDDFRIRLAAIKVLPGRRYQGASQTNLVDISGQLIEFAKTFGYDLDAGIDSGSIARDESLVVLVRRASYAKTIDDVPAEIQDGALRRIKR